MSEDTGEPRRVKICATLDPALLQAVDRFVRESPHYSRSRVIEDALQLWSKRQLERQMEAQYAPQPSAAEPDELEDWRRIRRAAATRSLHTE
jgi:Arc/MetJ-type ribon-helix-helix transcriptional regulator